MREKNLKVVAALTLTLSLSAFARVATKKCETSLKRSKAQSEEVAPASVTEAAPVDPADLLKGVLDKVQISRRANDLGFNLQTSATRALTREEAMTIVGAMVANDKTDVDTTADDIANIQLHGHFEKLFDITAILNSAYKSKLDVKMFAGNLAVIMSKFVVPNSDELGYQAGVVRKPNLKEAMQAFNFLVLAQGNAKKAQLTIMEIADALDTPDMDAITAVRFQAHVDGQDPVEMATALHDFAAQVSIQKKVMGYGKTTETVHPTALEAMALQNIAKQMKLDVKGLNQAIAKVQFVTGATDFVGIIQAMTQNSQPSPEEVAQK